jgi:hypothetical protein
MDYHGGNLWLGSIMHTAEAARCHRNMVLNRLARTQAITGHDFADPAAWSRSRCTPAFRCPAAPVSEWSASDFLCIAHIHVVENWS